MTLNSSFAVLLAMLALGAALVTQAAGRPWGSRSANSTIQITQEEGEEYYSGVTIPLFVLNYTSPLDAEKTREYAALWENHTLGQHIEAFCHNANLVCNSNMISIDDPRTDISRDELDDVQLFHDNGEPYVDGQALEFGDMNFVEGEEIVICESPHDLSSRIPTFLPNFLAEKMPLSSEKIQELLVTFHILHNSKLANMMFHTINHCEVVKEKTSKEIEVTKEKEIKGKEVVVSIEREFERKEIEHKRKEHKKKEIEFSKEKEVKVKKSKVVEEQEKKFKENVYKSSKENTSEEKKLKDKEIEYKNKEVKEKEKKVREKNIHESEEKDFHIHEEKASEDKKVKEKEIEHKNEMELKKKDIHGSEEKSREEKMIKEKEIIHNKEKESTKEEDFHITEEKVREDKKVKEKEIKKVRGRKKV